MTTVVEGASRGARAGRGLWIALALSLTLNVFVLGGLVWPMVAGEPPRQLGPIEHLLDDARSLGLTADQKAALQVFGASARRANLGLREANAPLMRQIWDEMAKPQPDATKVGELTDQVLEHRRTFQHTMSTNLMTFLATLSPEQRQRFAELAILRPTQAHPAAGQPGTR